MVRGMSKTSGGQSRAGILSPEVVSLDQMVGISSPPDVHMEPMKLLNRVGDARALSLTLLTERRHWRCFLSSNENIITELAGGTGLRALRCH